MNYMLKHLDHTGKVHELHYKQMLSFVEKVKVGKVLLMQDLNLQSKFVGKSLEEIDFSHMLYAATEVPTEEGDNNIEEEVEMEESDAINEDLDRDEDGSDKEIVQPRQHTSAIQRKNWSAEECRELKIYLGKSYKDLITPNKSLAMAAIQESRKKNGVLCVRPWHQIVKKMSADIIRMKKAKKKSMQKKSK